MKRPTDEMLMAYADGVLDADARRSVDRYLVDHAGDRRLVRMLRLVSLLVQEAFGDRDFDEGRERLAVRSGLVENGSKVSRIAGGRLNMAAGALFAGGALAATLLLSVVPSSNGLRPSPDAPFSVGQVAQGTELWNALETPGDDRGAGMDRRPIFVHVAEFKDKFDNTCRELDAFVPGQIRVPMAVIVACRTGEADWNVLGAVATAGPTSARGRMSYASDLSQAHDAVNSILSLIGAKQRTTSIGRESIEQ